MIVKINKIGNQYEAHIKSRSGESFFKTVTPIEKEQLNEVLLNLGFHQRDIYDAFHEADGTALNMPHPLFNAQEKSNE